MGTEMLTQLQKGTEILHKSFCIRIPIIQEDPVFFCELLLKVHAVYTGRWVKRGVLGRNV